MAVEFPVEASQFVTVASDWHGGQDSPLYSLASTGLIHDEAHASFLRREVLHCLSMKQDDELITLLSFTEALLE